MADHTQNKLISPLARARGLGSAHEGVHHWLLERITAALLMPLTVWLVYSILNLRGVSYEDFTAWVQNPLNAVLLIMFILAGFYHGAMGLQVVIEDYIARHYWRMFKIIAVKIAFAFMAVASIFSILKIAL